MDMKKIELSLLSFFFQMLFPVLIMVAAIEPLVFDPNFYIGILEENDLIGGLYGNFLPQELSSLLTEDFLKEQTTALLTSSFAVLKNGDKFDYELPVEELVDNIIDGIPDCDQREIISIDKGLPSCITSFLDRDTLKEQTLASYSIGDQNPLEPFENMLETGREYVVLATTAFYVIIGVLIVNVILMGVLIKDSLGLSKWLGYNILIAGILTAISAYFMPVIASTIVTNAAQPEIVGNIVVSLMNRISESMLSVSVYVVILGAVIKFLPPFIIKRK